jgi:phenylalanyl-tRNA synthetase beta chain
VLIESAHFLPARHGTARLGLQTDASHRFERGVDREGLGRAAARAARLIQELAGGTPSKDVVEALGELPGAIPEIRLDPSKANRLLGTEIPGEEMIDLLSRLDIEVGREQEGSLTCRPPSYRGDLQLPADLIEEIARLHGYDRILDPSRGAFAGRGAPRHRLMVKASESLKERLTGIMTFRRPGRVTPTRFSSSRRSAPPRRRAAQPIQSVDSVLRPPGAVSPASHPANLRRKVEALRLSRSAACFGARGATSPRSPPGRRRC